VLKQTNRIWFANELTHYLEKLRAAKESFIFRTTGPGEDIDDNDADEIAIIFENNEDCETITLNQIAHQFTEIENIFKTVRDVPVSDSCRLMAFAIFTIQFLTYYQGLLLNSDIIFIFRVIRIP